MNRSKTRRDARLPGFRQTLAAVCLVLAALAAPAHRADAQELLDKPVYNEDTKSYFELIDAPDGYSIRGAPDVSWEVAAKVARKRIYKGTAGRLAIVKSIKTVAFLEHTFQPQQEAWIGLRYWCKYRKLTWVTGEEHSLSAFKYWAKPWRAKNGCKEGYYAPVYFETPANGFRWRAQGMKKEWGRIFVEYPTGKP